MATDNSKSWWESALDSVTGFFDSATSSLSLSSSTQDTANPASETKTKDSDGWLPDWLNPTKWFDDMNPKDWFSTKNIVGAAVGGIVGTVFSGILGVITTPIKWLSYVIPGGQTGKKYAAD